ncbi:hypothetical protein Hanom_Chr06g00550261 [Helianthus anomalus]
MMKTVIGGIYHEIWLESGLFRAHIWFGSMFGSTRSNRVEPVNTQSNVVKKVNGSAVNRFGSWFGFTRSNRVNSVNSVKRFDIST